jgi:hypothetical protein
MKILKLLLIGIILLTLYSCDKEIIEEFVIDNDSEFILNIKYKTASGISSEKIVSKNAINVIILKHIDFAPEVFERELWKYFEYFEIKSDTLKSKINYRSNEAWIYTEKSNTHAVYYLKVDSTHFN